MIPEPDLPRWGIALQAWRVLIENSGAALRIAVLPFLILLAMHRLIDIVEPVGSQAFGWQLLRVVVFPVPAALLLVPWYRLILSAQRPELANRPARWWYVAFMIRTLWLELMLFAFQTPALVAGIMAMQTGDTPDPELGGLSFLLLMMGLLPGFFLYGRAGLSLPAAAAGDDDSYGRSWRVTGGAGWRIAGIVFVLWATFFVITGLLPVASPGILASAISAAVDVVRELVMAAALALVYLHYGRTPVEDVFS